MIGDPDPEYDDCSGAKSARVAMHGPQRRRPVERSAVTWGWFQGGFEPTEVAGGRAVCGAESANRVTGKHMKDYVPHHEPFQYYAQTANPHHARPESVASIGHTDAANHQYDLEDFYAALREKNLPAVSFVKAKKVENGHAGRAYSDPLDEQVFLVKLVNTVGASAYWKDAAIVIAYDDSDGWYDHAMPPILNASAIAGLDALNGNGRCGNTAAQAANDYQGRCGYGPRLPLLVISPYARVNFVDHALTDQTSILRFIEDNWSLGRLGDQSMDALAGSLETMFDFAHGNALPLALDPDSGKSQ